MKKAVLLSIFIISIFMISCAPPSESVPKEAGSTETCSPPLLEYEEGNCCTDTNNNNICDTDESQEVREKLRFPCDGRAGESFYLFTEIDGYDITTTKISCRKDVEILERKCIQNEGSYAGDMIEMNKVKQGNLVGWAQRSDLTCKDMYCNRAPDSIC